MVQELLGTVHWLFAGEEPEELKHDTHTGGDEQSWRWVSDLKHYYNARRQGTYREEWLTVSFGFSSARMVTS